MSDFNVLTTRSNQTDTVQASLLGMVTATPVHPSADPAFGCKLAEFRWCYPLLLVGDAGDGSHTTAARVAEFDLVPGVESDLRVLFYLHNIGDRHQIETAARVADAFSSVGRVILGAWGSLAGNQGATDAAGQIDGIMRQFHSTVAGSCDGFLANDVLILPNTPVAGRTDLTLDAWTVATGQRRFRAPEFVYRNKDEDFICDRRGSNYEVFFTLHRTSWRSWGWQPTY